MQQKIKKAIGLSINLQRGVVFLFESAILQGLSEVLSPLVKPPRLYGLDKLKVLNDRTIKLFNEDAKNIEEGFYPLTTLIRPKEILENMKLYPHIVFDSLKISSRRKNKKHREIETDQEIPDYLKRNYHFQTGGYFSSESAKLYAMQVEILFCGTASAMRRMLIRKIKEAPNFENENLHILEVACGVGSATQDFIKSFSYTRYVASDVSQEYLDLAQKKLKDESLDYKIMRAEELSEPDNSFDIVFSVFLFHELPRAERTKALKEAYRVLKPGGILAICDSLQKGDDEGLEEIIKNFPKDYHEPFYKEYTEWDTKEELQMIGFKEISSSHHFLSKYFIGIK